MGLVFMHLAGLTRVLCSGSTGLAVVVNYDSYSWGLGQLGLEQVDEHDS
jgi:hypothetical protein